MHTVRRYFALLRAQVMLSTSLGMQYRADFLLKGVLSLFWMGITLAPLLVVFSKRQTVAGWTYPEALVVLGWFSLLKGILEGGVSPSLTAVVEGVRTGALDFILLKPADSQFLVSTTRFEPWRLVDVVGALALLVYAFTLLGHAPTPAQIGLGVVFLVEAILLLYSLWILVISASFWAVRVDNLSHLFSSLFDAGRWPIDVFKGIFSGILRVLFTLVFPLALMTTYPALALLGKLSFRGSLLVMAGGMVFVALARAVWRQAIRFYTSASS